MAANATITISTFVETCASKKLTDPQSIPATPPRGSLCGGHCCCSRRLAGKPGFGERIEVSRVFEPSSKE